jgi:hypothetical protein
VDVRETKSKENETKIYNDELHDLHSSQKNYLVD